MLIIAVEQLFLTGSAEDVQFLHAMPTWLPSHRNGCRVEGTHFAFSIQLPAVAIRGHVHMMSAQGWGRCSKEALKGRLRENADKGKGVEKSKNYADIICTWPLTMHARKPRASRVVDTQKCISN